MVYPEANHSQTVSSPPDDTWNLAYFIFFWLGLGVLMPWFTFVTAIDYFADIYPGVHVDRIFSVCYNIPLLGFLLLLSLSPTSRTHAARAMVGFILFSLFTLSVPSVDLLGVKSSDSTVTGVQGTTTTLILTIAAVTVTGFADALAQGSTFAFVSDMPEKYTQAAVGGTAAAGVFVSTLRCGTKSILPLRRSAFLYFFVAFFCEALCIVAFRVANALPIVKYYKSQGRGRGTGSSAKGGEAIAAAIAEDWREVDWNAGRCSHHSDSIIAEGSDDHSRSHSRIIVEGRRRAIADGRDDVEHCMIDGDSVANDKRDEGHVILATSSKGRGSAMKLARGEEQNDEGENEWRGQRKDLGGKADYRHHLDDRGDGYADYPVQIPSRYAISTGKERSIAASNGSWDPDQGQEPQLDGDLVRPLLLLPPPPYHSIYQASFRQVTWHIRAYMATVTWTFVVSYSIFPGFITEDIHSAVLGSWYPVLLISCYNVGDFVGKMAPLLHAGTDWKVVRTLALWRGVFFLLFGLCSYGPPIFRREAFVFTLTLTLGLSNGFVVCRTMMEAPKQVKLYEAEAAGMLMILALVAGLALGKF